MLRLLAAFLLFRLFFPVPEIAPSGITCCDEQKIRLAMTEEALRRIADRNEDRARGETDYLCVQAHERIRRRLPAGGRDQVLDFMRQALRQTDPDGDTREFQELVSHFILGMTLEIGHTFQDEYDQARAGKEKIARLLATLEESPATGEEALNRAMFHADLSERELRHIRTLERRWRDRDGDASPFDEFSELRRNVRGLAADRDQRMAFMLAERYRTGYPFLDEFLKNYRRLAADFRETARRVNELLAARQE